jgi:hypothetical protein
VGAVLREQNALPYEAWIMKNLTAKDDVDNVGAGRAAKGANPVAFLALRYFMSKSCLTWKFLVYIYYNLTD